MAHTLEDSSLTFSYIVRVLFSKIDMCLIFFFFTFDCVTDKCSFTAPWLCSSVRFQSDYPLRGGLSLLILTRQSADVGASVSQAVTTDDLLKSLPHLLTPEGIDQWVNHRVAHDEDEIHVEVGHEAHAVEVPWAGNHQDQVEEEGSPADNEDPEQNGQRNGPFHAGSLVDGVVAGQGSNALYM